MSGSPRHDVAIYTPEAAVLYERRPEVTGGAERQTTLLAAGLARAGLDVAHIVLPVADPAPDLAPTLVQRELVTTRRGPATRIAQGRRIWSALAEANANVYVFRGGLPALGIAALFCRVRRRRLVFSASNDLDFSFDFMAGRRPELEVYRYGVSRADAVVVQTARQAMLAREAFPGLRLVVEIPSFAEAAPPARIPAEAFLWVGRLDHYKQPLRYLELAEALPEARFWMICRRLDPARSGGAPGGSGADDQLEAAVDRRARELPNLELLDQRPHDAAMKLVERAVAVVNTGSAEGMPNLFLEAWACGVPVLSYEFDPDGRIGRDGLGVAAAGSAARFVEGARALWGARANRDDLSDRVRAHLAERHGVEAVTARWAGLLAELQDDRS